MNRRAFLSWLGGTAAGAAAAHILDVERLLWVPGERAIFLPPASGNTFITAEWVSREVAKMFAETLKWSRYVDQQYDRQYV